MILRLRLPLFSRVYMLKRSLNLGMKLNLTYDNSLLYIYACIIVLVVDLARRSRQLCLEYHHPLLRVGTSRLNSHGNKLHPQALQDTDQHLLHHHRGIPPHQIVRKRGREGGREKEREREERERGREGGRERERENE